MFRPKPTRKRELKSIILEYVREAGSKKITHVHYVRTGINKKFKVEIRITKDD